MKKYILIFIGLIIVGLTIGGGVAYWNNANENNSSQQNSVQDAKEIDKAEAEYKANEERLKKQLANAKTIEEYKQKFIKDKKYKENCLGDKPIDYSMFDKNDINAANQAVACYQLKYDKKRGTKEADIEYYNFRSFYADFEGIQHKQIYDIDTSIYEMMNENYDKFPQKYYKFGLIIQFDEGDYLIVISNKYLNENFKDYVSEPEREILQFNVKFDNRIISDGRFIIPKSELEKYLEFWKNFKKKYPEYSREHDIDDVIESNKRDIARYPIAY